MPHSILGADRAAVGPFHTAEQVARNLSSSEVQAMLAIAGGEPRVRLIKPTAEQRYDEGGPTSDA
jgi:hypothetical protein